MWLSLLVSHPGASHGVDQPLRQQAAKSAAAEAERKLIQVGLKMVLGKAVVRAAAWAAALAFFAGTKGFPSAEFWLPLDGKLPLLGGSLPLRWGYGGDKRPTSSAPLPCLTTAPLPFSLPFKGRYAIMISV